MKKIFLSITALAMMLTIALSFAGCAIFKPKGNINQLPTSTEMLDSVTYDTLNGQNLEKDKKQQVVADVRRSVVAIAMKIESGTTYGSGVIVDMNKTDANGNIVEGENVFYILTCHHVISSAGLITVYLPDKENDNVGESDYNNDYVFTGEIGGDITSNKAVSLVGGDKNSDVAILKLDISGSNITKDDVVKAHFPKATYKPEVAEDVIAIGNPSGKLPGTVSFGTISYINRETTIGDVGDMTLYQLNLDIYHGSSGGALFNMSGELVGLTNAGSDTYSGLNYAIPYVVDARNGLNDNGFVNIASQLLASKTDRNYGYITGRIGLFGFVTTQESSLDGKTTIVRVSEVTLGSSAYLAGLRAGDKIRKVAIGDQTQLDGAPDITTNAQVTEIFKTLKANDKVSLLVQRENYFNHEDVRITMTATQYIFCDTGNYS